MEDKNEIARRILSDLKKEIRSQAVYPHGRDMYPYIGVKVLDRMIQSHLDQLGNRKEEKWDG